MEDLYKYEMHCHTSESSMCSRMTAFEAVHHFQDLGYTGVFITNHLTTAYPDEGTWEEKVDFLCNGYEEAKKEGDKIGLDVFFAWELSAAFDGAITWEHLLTYGLDKSWLISHPDLWEWDAKEYFDNVHKDGGFVVHAHPFREGVEKVILHPDYIDAVEALNTSHSDVSNYRAEQYAKMLNLPITCGSDIHSTDQKVHGVFYTNKKIEKPSEYGEILKIGKYKIYGERTIKE